MKRCKRMIPAVLAVLILSILPVGAMAAEPLTLRLGLHWEGAPIPGAQVRLHQICALEENGDLRLLDDYGQFPDIAALPGKPASVCRAWARNVEQYLSNHPEILPQDSCLTDDTGWAKFPAETGELQKGLYLVRGISREWEGNLYTTDPFFVMLPQKGQDGWEYQVTAETKPEQSGQLLSLRVIKQWKDRGQENLRPSQIQVTLFCNDQPYDTVTLPRNGKWVYQWAGLDARKNWSVVEVPVAGYESQVYKEGSTFYIINTPLRWPQGPGLPQTGQLWWPVPVLLAAGALLLAGDRVRKKEDADET